MKVTNKQQTIKKSEYKSTSVPQVASKRIFGRFNTDIENIHGRIAMTGITIGAINELTAHIRDSSVASSPTMYDQLVNDTQFAIESVTKIHNNVPVHVTSTGVTASIVFITSFFIIQAFGDINKTYEDEVQVFSKPGFTRESEILNGRVAMLVAMYILLSEQIYHHLLIA